MACTTRSATLAGGEQAELVRAVQATPGFLETLGVRPAQGRTLQAGDQVTPSVVLLSDRAWKRRFGGRADILGQTVRVNETTRTIVGVMPPDFEFMPATEIYMPLAREMLVALAASYPAALRGSRVGPMGAMRDE
jgi:hypothetical protein